MAGVLTQKQIQIQIAGWLLHITNHLYLSHATAKNWRGKIIVKEWIREQKWKGEISETTNSWTSTSYFLAAIHNTCCVCSFWPKSRSPLQGPGYLASSMCWKSQNFLETKHIPLIFPQTFATQYPVLHGPRGCENLNSLVPLLFFLPHVVWFIAKIWIFVFRWRRRCSWTWHTCQSTSLKRFTTLHMQSLPMKNTLPLHTKQPFQIILGCWFPQ
jgi:hypothetical protein